MKITALTLLLAFTFTHNAWAKDKTTTKKGLLPEVQLNSDNEDVNEQRAIGSEILITRAESKAIESLQSLIKKKKGSREEVDLLYRLAELYMRRSKTGRFFDLQISAHSKQLSLFPIPNEKGSDWVKKAVSIYTRIQNEFKKFPGMDSVYFNNAFAHQQLGKIKEAQKLYETLLEKHPTSELIPDALVSLGELYYDQKKFGTAAEFLNKLDKYADTRVYPYGMYKLAWTYYNMGNTGNGVKKLLQVVELSPINPDGEQARNKQYLRREAMRDLTVFIGETTPADELLGVFEKISKDDELGQAIIDLAKLNEGHSKWKEMNVFLSDFVRRHSDNTYAANALLYLVDTNEALKNRDKVIDYLNQTSKLCVTDSKWRLSHDKEIPDEACDHGFRTTAKDIAEKWWEIWLKNKKHQEFTALTEKSIKIIIDHEDRQKPDVKTHYAYAELLFALERFDQASEEYKFVAEKIDDPKMKHDATYAALFSIEKSIQKSKSALKEGLRKDLAAKYLEAYPKGPQAAEVSFKLAAIYYDEANYEMAEKWLTPSLQGVHGKDLQVKAQDMQLDIYNIRKDYASIQKLAKSVATSTTDAKRKDNMNLLLEQAAYTETQEVVKKGDKVEGAKLLVNFSQEYTKSAISADALWQAIGIYFSEGMTVTAADNVLRFYERFPNDKRAYDALKEASAAYIETGALNKAADTLKKLADLDKKDRRKNLELAADFYALEKKEKDARAIYNILLPDSSEKEKSLIYSKMLTMYSDKNSPEYKKIIQTLVSANVEPYATQSQFDHLKQLFDAKKNSEAFELARKIMSRNGEDTLRAKARLIQAQILEQELDHQSTKVSNADRLGLVLSMKTEKLEKAQTAFLSASKMSPDLQVQMEAFSGIDRCYSNYVQALKGLVLPSGLNPDDEKTLKGEIAKIVTQIEDKRADNQKQIAKLSKMKLYENSSSRVVASVEESIKPTVHYPAVKYVEAYLPANSEFIFSKMKRIEDKISEKCDSKSTKDFHKVMAACYQQKNSAEMEKLAQSLAATRENKLMGLYYLSLTAELQGLHQKSLWLADFALKSRSDTPLFTYQKARMTYYLDGISMALPVFDKVLDMQMSSTEMETFEGIKAFSASDFETASKKLSQLENDQLYTLEVGTLLSESYAQLGNADKALKLANDLLKKGPEYLELVLQKARVLETYKQAPEPALESYVKARTLAKDEEIKNWLDRKIELLKNQNKGRAARHIGSLGYGEDKL
jgi:tetratricopeptide (TPR) repeat protein